MIAALDDRLVNALERLVVGAVGMTTAALESFAPAVDLTLPQWRALVVVAQANGIRVGEIASRVGMSVPSTSRLVRRLERRGLVLTGRDDSDRRATIVRPTAEGTELWSTLVEHRRRLIGELIESLPQPLPTSLTDDLEALESAFGRYT